mmetsp:Transcript_34758/g.96106  ORF Transcript_34758/g.96106 Transcript_34758/m.96106 type:complete len:252 (-) Transcript_34758:388-1143(-)
MLARRRLQQLVVLDLQRRPGAERGHDDLLDSSLDRSYAPQHLRLRARGLRCLCVARLVNARDERRRGPGCHHHRPHRRLRAATLEAQVQHTREHRRGGPHRLRRRDLLPRRSALGQKLVLLPRGGPALPPGPSTGLRPVLVLPPRSSAARGGGRGDVLPKHGHCADARAGGLPGGAAVGGRRRAALLRAGAAARAAPLPLRLVAAGPDLRPSNRRVLPCPCRQLPAANAGRAGCPERGRLRWRPEVRRADA